MTSELYMHDGHLYRLQHEGVSKPVAMELARKYRSERTPSVITKALVVFGLTGYHVYTRKEQHYIKRSY